MGAMRVGLTAYGTKASDLMALAVAAEEVGFASLWVGEHVVLPVGYAPEHPSVQHAGARRAAERADGWFASGTPPFADAVALRDRLFELRHETGRTRPLRCWMRVAGAAPVVLARYADAGFEDVLIWADQVWPEAASIAHKH